MVMLAELMLLGFISFVLSLSQGFITSICIPETSTGIMLPCKRDNHIVAEGAKICKKKVRVLSYFHILNDSIMLDNKVFYHFKQCKVVLCKMFSRINMVKAIGLLCFRVMFPCYHWRHYISCTFSYLYLV